MVIYHAGVFDKSLSLSLVDTKWGIWYPRGPPIYKVSSTHHKKIKKASNISAFLVVIVINTPSS